MSAFQLTTKIIFIVTISLIGLSMLRPVPAFDDPRELVDSTIATLRAEVIANKARVASDPRFTMDMISRYLNPHVDLKITSRFVLGNYWRNASKYQQDAFVDALRRLLLRVFAIHISDYQDAEVTFAPTTYGGESTQRAVVRTTVKRSGVPPIRVDYRLYRSPAGWKVYDVAIVGVSLVKTYRLTMQYDLKKHGLDEMIDRLNALMPLPAD